ncbi:MAG TPA: hypoxanthine phosphoribosyltransferase [Candidatus Tumulicola sp.]|jgi:hypoxanthine phosphoribosyltransferase
MTAGIGSALGERLYSPAEIASAVDRLAAAVGLDFAGKPLVLLGVLKGALYLTVDLARALAAIPDGPSEIAVEYVCVSSYGAGLESSGRPQVLLDRTAPIEGRNVLIVDDLADSGLTLEAVRALLERRRPARVRQCVLFEKTSARWTEVPLDYVGLPVPEAFVVGYGLDYQEEYRTLPYLASLKEPQRKPTVPLT